MRLKESRYYAFPINPLSVNDAYLRNFARRGPPIRLSDDGARYKKKVSQWAELQDLKFHESQKLQWDENHPWFICEWLFLIPDSNFYRSPPGGDRWRHLNSKDVTNYFKLAEDGFFEYLGVNDTHVHTVVGMKAVSEMVGISRPLVLLSIRQVSDLPVPVIPIDANRSVSHVLSNYDLF